MIGRSKWRILAPLGVLLLFSTGCAKLESRDQLNKGVQAFRNNKYADAVNHFKEALNLDPTSENARSYLAVSYMVQWVPGAESKDNQKNYEMARKTFNEILAKQPTNAMALAYMASMAFQTAANGTDEQKHAALEEARKWNERRIEVDPKDPEPYYYLGVIDWSEAFPAIRQARSEQKMKPDDPGPLKDAKLKEDIKSKYDAMIDSGIEQLNKCLTNDKENEDAMTYLNLLYREKATLADNVDQAKDYIKKAEEWSDKSLEMRKIKASRPAKKAEEKTTS
jgi:tetratricopeptide (TPR) repeat protein